jgi:hypothetical protein
MAQPVVVREQGDTGLCLGLCCGDLFQVQQQMHEVGVRSGIVREGQPDRAASGVCLDIVAQGPHDERMRAQQPEMIGKSAHSLIEHVFRFDEAT